MMQISSDPASNKHSLLNVMHRFIAAANNMDETIMVPSLLRDMPLEEQQQQQQQQSAASQVEANNNNNNELPCNKQQRDMYEHYLLLKSIKNDMEWGLLKREMSSGASFLEMAVKQEEQKSVSGDLLEDNSDLENQFHYHLRGLFGVLSKLTLQADHLTNRYKREIGGGNFMR
ncbi:mid1-interacting protein 1-like [Neosynchiropus ocellatus]